MKETNSEKTLQSSGLSRRSFLGYAGAFAGAGILLSACQNDDTVIDYNPDANQGVVNLGSGDVGILNYAYALEQLEAAFYTQVVNNMFSNATAVERAFLTDIRDHEVAHREFFKKAIPADRVIKDLEPNFASIDFGNRDSVLAAAKTFEDLGVSAYNGAGKLIVNADYLVLAGKIVSVEARHAALIRDLISNGSFAASTDANGMDTALMPMDVLTAAAPFIKTKITGRDLPTT